MESTTKKKVDVYEIVTNKIIEMLEKGMPPWRKTWGQQAFAQNYESGHIYTGINWFLLNLVAPYTQPYYLTWAQVKKLEGKIKKGAKAEYVYFYKSFYKDKDGNTISERDVHFGSYDEKDLENVRFLKSYKVFNIECVEGIEWNLPSPELRFNSPIEECEVILNSMTKQPKLVSDDLYNAFYSPKDDIINIPPINSFETSAHFYNTVFHELVHWTGSVKRLNRNAFQKVVQKGGKEYAEEELIAELGACYLCGYTGIDRVQILENNAAYLQSWISRLKEDTKMIFRVTPKAQEAVGFILGI